MLDAVPVDPIDALFDRRHRRAEGNRYGALLLETQAVRARQRGKSPPGRRARLAVEDALVAFTGDRDVRFAEGVDERRVVEHVVAFPACQHVGVLPWVGAEEQRCAANEMQFDATAQMDRAS